MNFPVWDVGFGLPLLIALVAIPHVFVSHFAIGGGLFLLIYENQARKNNDAALLDYTRRHSRFFLLLTLVFGALSGVGIWFTIGLIHPAATSALIHAFVWFWAIEWVMFIVEITASLVYYYGWDRLSPALHRKVMWIYFGAAWGSLVVINAIITFMLSSGTWPADRNIWGAILNPTYFPSLFARTFICFMMAGVFAYITAAWLDDKPLRGRINRIASLWSLGSLILLTASLLWYHAALPAAVKEITGAGWIALNVSVKVWKVSAALLAALIIAGLAFRKDGFCKVGALLVGILAFGIFGSFEWYREAARKPYVIAGYMYSNSVLLSDTTAIRESGYTPHLKWKHDDPARLGEDIYRAACASCHSLAGYNGIAVKIGKRGWSEEAVRELVPRTGLMRGAMPPWLGTDEEAALVAGYLSVEAKRAAAKPLPKTPENAWAANCGLCHTISGFRPLKDALSGMSEADVKDVVLTSGDLSTSMPKFTGGDAEAGLIAAYATGELSNLTAKGGK